MSLLRLLLPSTWSHFSTIEFVPPVLSKRTISPSLVSPFLHELHHYPTQGSPPLSFTFSLFRVHTDYSTSSSSLQVHRCHSLTSLLLSSLLLPFPPLLPPSVPLRRLRVVLVCHIPKHPMEPPQSSPCRPYLLRNSSKRHRLPLVSLTYYRLPSIPKFFLYKIPSFLIR